MQGVVGMFDGFSPMPFLEYRFGEEGLGATLEELSSGEHPNLSMVECAYHMGYFPEAVEAADVVIADGPGSADAAIARGLKLHALVSLGDGQAAQACLEDAVQACRALCKNEDCNLHLTGVIAAKILEDCTFIPIPEAQEDIDCLEDLPSGARAYSGFQMAYRAYRVGDDGRAIGIAHSFLALAGHRYPVSCVKLHLVAAAAYLRMGDVDSALGEFREAWDFAHPLGIIAPFVEMSASMPGLMRHELHDRDESSFLLLRTLISRYRKGWHELRICCQMPMAGETLTILEYTCGTMAAWGWSNRETAQFLGLAESTVKHYLTNVYQKLEVGSRKQLTDALMSGEIGGKQTLMSAPSSKSASVVENRLYSTF